jgi:hypothetical protein
MSTLKRIEIRKVVDLEIKRCQRKSHQYKSLNSEQIRIIIAQFRRFIQAG